MTSHSRHALLWGFLALSNIYIFPPGVDAFWRMNCGLIQTGRLDLIVSPGAVATHVHKISGASNFGPSSTYADLLASQCTSCEIQADKSAYWTPQLYYQHGDGTTFDEVPNGGTVVYYLGRGENRSNIEPFPPGFRMVSGDASLRSNDTGSMTYADPSKNIRGRPLSDRVSFACLDSTAGPMPEQNYMFRTECDNGLRAQIQFPSCWDGRAYQADQSHVAHMSQIDNGVCPPSHPRQLAHLFFEVLYGVNDVRQEAGGRFVFANGDPTGFGFHGDFLNGWDAAVLEDAIAQCVNNDDIDGRIDRCPPLAKSQTPYFSTNCPECPPMVDEKVRGTVVGGLPGCNIVTEGPGRAVSPPPSCPVPSMNQVPNQEAIPMFDAVVGQKLASGSTWAFSGCVADDGNMRALSGYATSSNNMTIETCTVACGARGFPLAGLEYSRECYCGKTLGGGGNSNSAVNCTAMPKMVCAGNATQWCGAPKLLTLWNDTSSASSNTASGGSSQLAAANGTAVYVACYTDGNGGRTLDRDSYSSDAMTVDACAAFCQSKNYALLGVEYGRECYCGNAARAAASSLVGSEKECGMACKGNTSQTCGGSARISVWNNTLYVPTRSPTSVNNGQFGYMGCYSEGTSGRALGKSSGNGSGKSDVTNDAKMTVEKCAMFCSGKGYMYMGVEYGQECYCNNKGPVNGAVRAGEGDCSMACKGDLTEWCGGGSRINVYKADDV